MGLNPYYIEVRGEQRQTTNGDLMVILLMFWFDFEIISNGCDDWVLSVFLSLLWLCYSCSDLILKSSVMIVMDEYCATVLKLT